MTHSVVSRLAILFFAFSGATRAFAYDVSNYQRVTLDCRVRANGVLVHAFRSLRMDGNIHYLAVDAETFKTDLIESSLLTCDSSYSPAVAQSRYGRALSLAHSPPFPRRNDGIQRRAQKTGGVFLTADLCPASRGKFEHRFFDELERLSQKTGAPVPIALAVSGRWIRTHENEFNEILHLIKKDRLSVTWVNHSDTHPYHRDANEDVNFLLSPGTSVDREIYGVELELLKRNELPSVFFRFPGLISSEQWMKRVLEHSLIPIGSDAWLARDEAARPGSIVLLHANGNEPSGITLFLYQITRLEDFGAFAPISKLF